MDASGARSPARPAAARSQPTGRARDAATRFDVADGIPNLRLACGCARPRRCAASTSARRSPAIRRATVCRALRARAERNAFARLLDRAIPGDARIVGRRLRHRPDVPVPRARRPRGRRRRSDARVARARRRRGRAIRARAACSSSRPISVSPASSAAPSTSSTRRASCTTRRDPRASFAQTGRSWRGRAASSCSASTTRSRAFRTRLRRAVARLSGYRVVPVRSGPARSRARAGAPRGLAARSVPASRGAPSHASPKCSAGSRRMASSICARIRARCSTTTPEDLFARAADNWGLESWLAQIGWMRTLGREGGLFFTIGRKEE